MEKCNICLRDRRRKCRQCGTWDETFIECEICGNEWGWHNIESEEEKTPSEIYDSSESSYDNDDELYELVKGCIQDIPKVRDYSIGNWIRKFDWKKMAPLYDKLFDSYI